MALQGSLWANLRQTDNTAFLTNPSTLATYIISKGKGRVPLHYSIQQEVLLIWASKLLSPHKQLALIKMTESGLDRWKKKAGWMQGQVVRCRKCMGNEVKISLQWCVVGRQWGHHFRSSRKLWGTTGRLLRSEWKHTGGMHNLRSNQYSLWVLLWVPKEVVANGTHSDAPANYI